MGTWKKMREGGSIYIKKLVKINCQFCPHPSLYEFIPIYIYFFIITSSSFFFLFLVCFVVYLNNLTSETLCANHTVSMEEHMLTANALI